MRFHITPQSSLNDEVLQIRGENFPPHHQIEITALTEDFFGRQWQSQAWYVADARGIIDLSQQAPVKGTYQEADPMGLIWSMQPADNNYHASLFIPIQGTCFQIHFTVRDKNKIIFTKTIDRRFTQQKIIEQEIAEINVKGRLFLPPGQQPLPGIMLCSGSGGGIKSEIHLANLLASHGYAVFILAYFNYADYEKELYEIPLERFQFGIRWFRQHPHINADRIVAMAPGKGAEGILAATALLENNLLKGIIAISPSNVIWQGLGKGKPKQMSSWSLQKKALPYLSIASKRILPQFIRNLIIQKCRLQRFFSSLTRTNLLSVYRVVKKDSLEANNAEIPVEKIQAPLLLIAGENDKMWPSVYMAKSIQKRRQSNPYHSQDELLILENAGHVIRYPYLPTSIAWLVTPGGKMIINFGGSTEGNANAQIKAWKRILNFLRTHLDS